MTPDVPTPIGTIGDFTLLERLEPAGPGDLYRARDMRLGRTVVVRLLPADFAPSSPDRNALVTKAQLLIGLSHPNVTALFQAGEHDGRVFLAFEYVNGRSLRAEMAGRPMNVRRAVELAIQMTDAVADAHAAGFVHVGLSPDSVMITARGHAKIPAFELAARGGYETLDAQTVRLRDYVAPEEAAGTGGDERSDIYSLAAILYECLTNRRPPHKGAAAPSRANPRVPAELDEIVLAAVAPNPARRPGTAATLSAELRSLLAILDVRGVAGEDELQDAPRSSRAGTVVAIVVLLLIVAAALLLWN